MKYVQLTSLFIAVMACTVAINSANARSVFDGPQSVTTQTIGGSCSSAVSFGVEIRDGIVLGYGGECARPRSSQRCRAGERIRGRSVCERQRTAYARIRQRRVAGPRLSRLLRRALGGAAALTLLAARA